MIRPERSRIAKLGRRQVSWKGGGRRRWQTGWRGLHFVSVESGPKRKGECTLEVIVDNDSEIGVKGVGR